MDEKGQGAGDTEEGRQPEGGTEGDIDPRLVVLGFLEEVSDRPPTGEREPASGDDERRRGEYLDHPQLSFTIPGRAGGKPSPRSN